MLWWIAAAPAATLQLDIAGLRNREGVVQVSVFRNERGFPERPELAAHAVTVSTEAPTVRLELEPGPWAVAVLHDENENGRLDRGVFGVPREGYGASNEAHWRLGLPRFRDAVVQVPEAGARLAVAEAGREGHAEQFRIRGELLDLLVAPVDRWRDRRVWSLPADDIRGLVLEEPGLTSRLERDAAGSWTLVEPANVDADPARARAAAQAELRVERWVAVEPVEAGFPGALWIRVDAGGPLRTLQVGSRVGTEGAQYHVRTADQPERIDVIDGRVLVGLRGA